MNETSQKQMETKKIEEKLSSKRADFDQIMKEIEPFIKKSEGCEKSTSGKWSSGSAAQEIKKMTKESTLVFSLRR